MKFHRGIIHSSLNVQMTLMSLHCWLDKQIVVHPYNGIQFAQKREWSTDTCYSVDETSRYTQWKKLNVKAYVWHDSIYV